MTPVALLLTSFFSLGPVTHEKAIALSLCSPHESYLSGEELFHRWLFLLDAPHAEAGMGVLPSYEYCSRVTAFLAAFSRNLRSRADWEEDRREGLLEAAKRVEALQVPWEAAERYQSNWCSGVYYRRCTLKSIRDSARGRGDYKGISLPDIEEELSPLMRRVP